MDRPIYAEPRIHGFRGWLACLSGEARARRNCTVLQREDRENTAERKRLSL